jgi:glycerophosphoryl diester phosphodiesterase
LINGLKDRKTPLVIGHRGSAGEAPENTLASFRLAVARQCDMIELDVHLSRDGLPVVCHDATIDRTTDGRGAIRDKTAAELRSYDAGSWFDRRFAGERIPLLSEVLELVPANIVLNIELKHGWDGRLESHVLGCVREHGRMDSVLFSSFDHRMLHRLKQAAPEANIGLVYAAGLLDPVKLVRDFGEDVFSVHVHGPLTDREEIARLKAGGWLAVVWTLNEPEQVREAVAAGASGIVTDHPGAVRQWLNAAVG